VNQRSPNPRLQRTRAALRLQSLIGTCSSLSGDRRAPLSRQPLGDSPEGVRGGRLVTADRRRVQAGGTPRSAALAQGLIRCGQSAGVA
jgi:hypothetical protein